MSMHQIARIEFRIAKFPYARGLCPLATPARGPAPWTPVFVTNFTAPRRKAILDPPVAGRTTFVCLKILLINCTCKIC